MGQHFGAVHTFPVEGVVGHTVVLVPADLGGHEHVDAGFLQDLGKRPGITEDIRQPQVFHFFAELIFDEFASDEDLACQGFPAGQVAVGFYPHTAVYFPASFFDLFLDLFIDFREIFFYIFV